jgi:hypothetical protein
MHAMNDVRLPLDLERLPEFRALAGKMPEPADPIALFCVFRLFVELGYRAQANEPFAAMTRDELDLFVRYMPYGTAEALLNSRWLVPAAEGGFTCERFARMNAHLAHPLSYAQRNQRVSLISRRAKHVQAEADAQALLLPPEIYRKKNGEVMDADLANRVRVCIITIDRCLERPQRPAAEYGDGLMADAAEVCESDREELVPFYRWLIVNREHPAVPKTTEQVLANFASILRMMRNNK